jgi:hypothetical protein
VAGRGSRDDLVLADAGVAALLQHEAVVEEKVDGANVVMWRDETGRIDCALRSGPGSMDRAGQRGPLRAWVADRQDVLRPALDRWPVLYAEWLLLAHAVAYDRLPSYAAVLDLWRPDDGFASVDERNAVCHDAGLVTPPELWRGTPGSVAHIEALLDASAWGPLPAEGVVVRRVDPGPSGLLSGEQGPSGPTKTSVATSMGLSPARTVSLELRSSGSRRSNARLGMSGVSAPPRLAKLVRAGFIQRSDAAWRSGPSRNRLAVGEGSWH